MRRGIRTARGAAVIVVTLLMAAACSSGSSSSSSKSTTTGKSSEKADPLAKAQAATAAGFKGTNRNVDSKSRPAAKNKSIVVISAGQAASTGFVPSNGAVAAAKAIGWKVDLYDAKLAPSNYAPLIRQAIAAGVDGIVLDAADCAQVKQPLEEAKAKHIPVIPMFGFDCTDPHAGGGGQALFPANINYDTDDAAAFTEQYGASQANYIIANSDNKAKIITIMDPEFSVLYWSNQGFDKTITASGGSEVVDTLEVTSSDLTSGQIVPKIQAELLKHPEATWIKSPYTYVTTLGIVPALKDNPNHIKVMGGEGYIDELNLIRESKITAVNVISSERVGWAGVDTLNSVFIGQKPAASGIGWTMVDADHNLPASGPFVTPIDFKAEYKAAWGVS